MSRDLVEKARTGDREAMAELWRLYAPMVTGAVLARVGRFQEADDIVQDTFLRAVQQIGALRDPEQLGSWLYGIALNVTREHLRARRVPTARLPELAVVDEAEESSPGVDPAGLRTCLNALPLTLRELFVLRHIQGMSYKQLADLRNATVSSVGERLWKARQLIRRCLESKGALPEAIR